MLVNSYKREKKEGKKKKHLLDTLKKCCAFEIYSGSPTWKKYTYMLLHVSTIPLMSVLFEILKMMDV